MLDDILLKLAKRSHQSGHQSACKTIGGRSVLNMTGPLVPKEIVVRIRIVTSQGKYSRLVPGARAAYSTMGHALADLSKKRRCFYQTTICARQGFGRERQLDKGPDLPGSFNRKFAASLETTFPRLPEQIIDDVEGCWQGMCCSKTQKYPSPPRVSPATRKLCRSTSRPLTGTRSDNSNQPKSSSLALSGGLTDANPIIVHHLRSFKYLYVHPDKITNFVVGLGNICKSDVLDLFSESLRTKPASLSSSVARVILRMGNGRTICRFTKQLLFSRPIAPNGFGAMAHNPSATPIASLAFMQKATVR